MKKILSILLPVAILAVAIGGFRFLTATKPEQQPPQMRERIWRVATAEIAPARLAPELWLHGRVETPDLLGLTASAPAWVEQVAVRAGDPVAQGQLLARLDPRDFLPRIAQTRADVDALDAEIDSEHQRHQADVLALAEEQQLLELAVSGVERQQRLKAQQVGAEQALDEARQQQAQRALAVASREISLADHPNRLRALQAKRASAQARLEQLELESARASLVAPYDAVIADVLVTAGDQVARGERLLALYPSASLEVRARIPAPHQDEILAALAAGESLSAHATVGGVNLALHLARLGGEAEASGIDGYFAIESHAEMLRPGQLLGLRLARPAAVDAVALPMAAVYGGERVYELAEEPGADGQESVTRLRGVAVELLGTRLDDQGRELALVRSVELSAGDRVVVTHLPNAIEGLRVEAVP